MFDMVRKRRLEEFTQLVESFDDQAQSLSEFFKQLGQDVSVWKDLKDWLLYECFGLRGIFILFLCSWNNLYFVNVQAV